MRKILFEEVVQANTEPGLPGTGTPPYHFHIGYPTPWSEGTVVRVRTDGGREWLANVQAGWGYASKIILWQQAEMVVIIAGGACYFAPANDPGEWRFVDAMAIDCLIVEDASLAVVSTYHDVVAVASDGNVIWRQVVAVEGVQINSISRGVVSGQACQDPPDAWTPFHLRLCDGEYLEGTVARYRREK